MSKTHWRWESAAILHLEMCRLHQRVRDRAPALSLIHCWKESDCSGCCAPGLPALRCGVPGAPVLPVLWSLLLRHPWGQWMLAQALGSLPPALGLRCGRNVWFLAPARSSPSCYGHVGELADGSFSTFQVKWNQVLKMALTN